MLATTEALALIKNAKLKGIDAVYAYNIPKEQIDNMDQTIVLIRDANSNPDMYASNGFQAVNREVEIQIFYAMHPAVEPESLEINLYKLFERNNWDLGQNRGHTIDPDTQQLTDTFYVYNLELIDK